MLSAFRKHVLGLKAERTFGKALKSVEIFRKYSSICNIFNGWHKLAVISVCFWTCVLGLQKTIFSDVKLGFLGIKIFSFKKRVKYLKSAYKTASNDIEFVSFSNKKYFDTISDKDPSYGFYNLNTCLFLNFTFFCRSYFLINRKQYFYAKKTSLSTCSTEMVYQEKIKNHVYPDFPKNFECRLKPYSGCNAPSLTYQNVLQRHFAKFLISKFLQLIFSRLGCR